MQKKQYIWKLVWVNILVLAVMVFGIEAAVRWTMPGINNQGTDGNLMKDNRYGDSPGLRPGAQGLVFGKKVQVGRDGFIETSVPPDSTKPVRLILGDSVTMGVGVDADSSFVGRLAKYYQHTLRLSNASLIGYSNKDYLNVAEHLLATDTKVKGITVFFCLNDVYEGTTAVPMMSRKGWLAPAFTFLKQNSKAYMFLKGILSDRAKAYFDFDYAFYAANPDLVKLAADRLDTINQACIKKGVSFNVVLLPYEYQLRNKDVDSLRAPQHSLQLLLEERLINVMDATDAAAEVLQPAAEGYLYADGIHFSNRGHLAISRFIIDKKLTEL